MECTLERPTRLSAQDLSSPTLRAPSHDPAGAPCIQVEPATPNGSPEAAIAEVPSRTTAQQTADQVSITDAATSNHQHIAESPAQVSVSSDVVTGPQTSNVVQSVAQQDRTIETKRGTAWIPTSLNSGFFTRRRHKSGTSSAPSTQNQPLQTQTPGSAGSSSLQGSLSASTQFTVSSRTTVDQNCAFTETVGSPCIYALKGYKHMYLAHPLERRVSSRMESEWQREIRPRLVVDLSSVVDALSSQRETVVEPELRLAGKAKAGAVKLYPLVLIRCGGRESQARVEDHVKHLTYLKDFSQGRILVLRGAPSLAAESSLSSFINDAEAEDGPDGRFLYLRDSTSLSGCGIRLLAEDNNGTHICTIGGLIWVDDIAYGLTTAHSVIPLEDLSHSADASTTGTDSDSEYSVSFGSDTSESSVSPTVSSSPRSISRNDHAQGPSQQYPAVGSLSPEASSKGPSVRLGPYALGPRTFPNIDQEMSSAIEANDFALVHLPRGYEYLSNNYETSIGGTYSVTGIVDHETDIASSEVMIVCSRNDIRPGRLLQEEAVLLTRSVKYHTRKIQTSRPLEKGLSGAWVVRQQTLIGIVVAVYVDEPYAHILSADKVFSNITSLLSTPSLTPKITLQPRRTAYTARAAGKRPRIYAEPERQPLLQRQSSFGSIRAQISPPDSPDTVQESSQVRPLVPAYPGCRCILCVSGSWCGVSGASVEVLVFCVLLVALLATPLIYLVTSTPL